MLQRGAKRCYEWLQTKHVGEIVERSEIRDAAQWKEKSLQTYFNKNKLLPFLLPLTETTVRILMDGADISEQYFHEVFTQTAPKLSILHVDQVLTGATGTYQLVAPLGRGAVGHVWSAQDTSLPTKPLVAVKVMLPRQDLLDGSKLVNVRERFRREALNGALLNHANIVKYLDHGNHEGNPFLVMEIADTSTGALQQKDIKAGHDGAQTIEETADVIFHVAKGLEYLHSMGMLHRDVKPDNILHFPNQIKLGDLGIVRWTDFDRAAVTAGSITRASIQLGSWFYMAPEQQQAPHEATPASDIYALGVTWIELLTGSLPSPPAIGAKAYSPPSEDPAVCEIIGRMVSYHPIERPALPEVLAFAEGLAS